MRWLQTAESGVREARIEAETADKLLHEARTQVETSEFMRVKSADELSSANQFLDMVKMTQGITTEGEPCNCASIVAATLARTKQESDKRGRTETSMEGLLLTARAHADPQAKHFAMQAVRILILQFT